MDDSIATTIAPLLVENLTQAANQALNETVRFKSTTEGMICAYTSIVLMAILPIYYGAVRSLSHQKEVSEKFKVAPEQVEALTDKDALTFPIYASAALLGFYFLMKINPHIVNLALSAYFFTLGVLALNRIVRPKFMSIFPARYNITTYSIMFGTRDHETEQSDQGRESPSAKSESSIGEFVPHDVYFSQKFVHSDILAFVITLCIGFVYAYNRHWVISNLFGMSFALNGIELVPINTAKIGCILLIGLFFYDIFWVFGTDVMVSVAKDFDAPVKLLFPQDFLVNGIFGNKFAMLGLGDIVVPGVFLAFLMRFDRSLNRNSRTYFYSGFAAYMAGMAMTIGFMTYFNHAQPALLYLVPCCLLTPLTVALIKGDLKTLFTYKDLPDLPEEVENAENESDNESNDETDCEQTEESTTKKRSTVSTRSTSKKNK